MKKRLTVWLWEVLAAAPWAFLISAGINGQQQGYKNHDNTLMFMGYLVIASALAGWKTTSLPKP